MRQFELRRILVTRDTLIQIIMDSSGRYGLEKRTHNLYSHNFYDGWHREKWYIILNVVNVKITYHFCIDDFMRFIVFLHFAWLRRSGTGLVDIRWSLPM